MAFFLARVFLSLGLGLALALVLLPGTALASPPAYEAVDAAAGAVPQWSDTVTIEKRDGGASGYQLIAVVDVEQAKRVPLTADLPYWFAFYRQFWNADGSRHISDVFDARRYQNSQGCDPRRYRDGNPYAVVGLSHDGIHSPTNPRRPSRAFLQSPFFAMQSCHTAGHVRGGHTRLRRVSSRFVARVGSLQHGLIPGQSSLGPNYHPANGLGITLNFKLYVDETVTLAQRSSSYYGISYKRNVRAGEVTADGFGIVPVDPNPLGEPSRPFLQWMFVVPKGKEVAISRCQPGVMGCGTQFAHVNQVLLHDPPLWTASDEEMQRRLVSQGEPLGFGDRVTAADRRREGFYHLKRMDGTWKYKPVSQAEALDLIRACKCLSVNGSGNNFQSAVWNGAAMAEEIGRDSAVHYYMPQAGNLVGYELANNQAARRALQAVYRMSQNEQVTVNLQTHSWGGYVATTSCQGTCRYVNHISYAPATLPSRWPRLREQYRRFSGSGVLVYSDNDLLAKSTFWRTKAGIQRNRKWQTRVIRAGHGLKQILQSGNFGQFAR